VIGQAKGVLMHRHRITSERAFAELREVSQRLNIKLRDIAQRVVDTGEMPSSAF
jgi:AmiR/NasT family two-component response regulator